MRILSSSTRTALQGPRRVRGNLILAKRQVQYANRIEPDEAGLLLVEEWLTL